MLLLRSCTMIARCRPGVRFENVNRKCRLSFFLVVGLGRAQGPCGRLNKTVVLKIQLACVCYRQALPESEASMEKAICAIREREKKMQIVIFPRRGRGRAQGPSGRLNPTAASKIQLACVCYRQALPVVPPAWRKRTRIVRCTYI